MNTVEYTSDEIQAQVEQAEYKNAFDAFEAAVASGKLSDMNSAFWDIVGCEASKLGEDYEREVSKILEDTQFVLEDCEVKLKPELAKLEVEGKTVEVRVTGVDEFNLASFEVHVEDELVAVTGEWLDDDNDVVRTERNNDYNRDEMEKVRDELGLDDDTFRSVENEIYELVEAQAKFLIAA